MEVIKPEGFVNIKGYKIPYHHDPKIDCGCSVCALANERISLEFFLGLYLSNYMSDCISLCEFTDDKGNVDVTNKQYQQLKSYITEKETCLLQFFTNEDLIYTSDGSVPTPNIKGE